MMALLAVLAAACSETRNGEESSRPPYIEDRNFQVENPSRDHASATGIGCGGTEKEALLDARNTARFNLRGVTGNATYKIRFTHVRDIPREGLVCMEVKATAVDAI